MQYDRLRGIIIYMARSQNGWSAPARVKTYYIAGRPVPLRVGAAGRLLELFGEDFHRKVEPVTQGRDDWGYAYRPVTGGGSLSNHSSGTAIDLNAVQHPYGRRGTFSRKQQRRIRKLLRKYNHVIRWGGEYADEMHFEVVGSYAQVVRTLREVRRGKDKKKKKIQLDKVRPGKKNKHVKAVKKRMKQKGLLHSGAVHKTYGPNFRKDVARWQRNHGVKRPNGIVGRRMLKKLGFRVK